MISKPRAESFPCKPQILLDCPDCHLDDEDDEMALWVLCEKHKDDFFECGCEMPEEMKN